MMKNLPVPVADEEIEEMFEYADKNKDGKLSYRFVFGPSKMPKSLNDCLT